MPDLALLSVIAIVLLALVFDFTNGFHDAANSIATVVSTRVLTPRMAVIWAAFFNFAAFFVFHTKVANTVGKTVDPAVVSEAVVFAGLVGAIAWNLLHLVAGAADLVLARADRRVRRGRRGQGRLQRPERGQPGEDHPVHRAVAAVRAGPRVPAHAGQPVAVPEVHPGQGRQPVPPPPARLGGRLQPRPRRQRRPEDHGHHQRPAGRRRLPPARGRTATCRSRSGW